jgi:hypothetical protein
VAPVKLVPVMVTLVPPAVRPLFGATAVTVGAGGLISTNAGWLLLMTKFWSPL